MQAVLAAHAAAVAAEALHVGVVGVLGAYPPRPRVERVLFIYVVVISFSRSEKKHQERVVSGGACGPAQSKGDPSVRPNLEV